MSHPFPWHTLIFLPVGFVVGFVAVWIAYKISDWINKNK